MGSYGMGWWENDDGIVGKSPNPKYIRCEIHAYSRYCEMCMTITRRSKKQTLMGTSMSASRSSGTFSMRDELIPVQGRLSKYFLSSNLLKNMIHIYHKTLNI